MAYSIVIDPRAIKDIQEAIDYYEEQQPGIGERFETVLNKHLLILKNTPYFRVRYDKVHCLPIKKFPFMVHFTIDEDQQVVSVRADLHMALDPKKWNNRI